jgi:hypothetical protein
MLPARKLSKNRNSIALRLMVINATIAQTYTVR